PVWLYPDALVRVLATVLPGLQVPDEPRAGAMPPSGGRRPENLAEYGIPDLDEDERAWLHAEADAFDTHALAQPEVLESYGASWDYPSGGTIAVSVEAAHDVPADVQAVAEDGEGMMLYELRWYAADPQQLRQDPLPAVLRSECADARTRLETAAAAIPPATGGQATDDDEFLVQL